VQGHQGRIVHWLASGLAVLLCAPAAHAAPPFDVAYRAWDIVTELARRNGDAGISGDCGRTFRPFVSPGLRMQTREDQDISATACVEAARAACRNGKLRTQPDTAKKCEEFVR
jgi:hypothetical protein